MAHNDHAMDVFFRAVTDFVFVAHEPAPADVLFIPGSDSEAHVLHGAALYRAGLAPWVLPSGLHPIGQEKFSQEGYPSEWAWMRQLLMANGVPEGAILREDSATYTWQNAQFSRGVTDALGLKVRRGLISCKPCHARRALFYYQAAFPEAELRVCPASVPGRNRDDWFLTAEGRAQVLGEVRRLGSQINDVLEDAL